MKHVKVLQVGDNNFKLLIKINTLKELKRDLDVLVLGEMLDDVWGNFSADFKDYRECNLENYNAGSAKRFGVAIECLISGYLTYKKQELYPIDITEGCEAGIN